MYDWGIIQEFCDKNLPTRRQISNEFGCALGTIDYAVLSGKLRLQSKSKKTKSKYNWKQIQKYYDNNHTYQDVIEKFGCSESTIHRAVKKGKLKPRNKSDANKLALQKNPRKHSKETKKKISKSRKKFIIENPEMAPYKMNHYSKGPSYPEKYFADLFEKENIVLERYYQIHLYELDFANVKSKVDIEIDGSQHRYDPRIVKSDRKRDNYLASKGWKVYRVYWPEYQKKSLEEKIEIVKEIKELLSPE